MPAEPSTFTVKDGKLAKLEVASIEGGGVHNLASVCLVCSLQIVCVNRLKEQWTTFVARLIFSGFFATSLTHISIISSDESNRQTHGL